jgi:hypothetical protein
MSTTYTTVTGQPGGYYINGYETFAVVADTAANVAAAIDEVKQESKLMLPLMQASGVGGPIAVGAIRPVNVDYIVRLDEFTQ